MSSDDVSKDQTDVNQQNDEWIVQAKPRRLVPQHSLSRQDIEADKNKVPTTPKKVIRFTKEEMMTFRQPAKLLSNMAEMVEVISLDRLNPVCFERFEPEDVIKIWNSEKKGPPGGVDAAGRGRGRGKTFRAEDQAQGSGEHVPGDWSTARSQPQSSKGGLWDDAGASGAGGADNLDLGDFAAMALKFRAEMEQMKLSGEADGEMGGLGGEEDMMERLMREQNARGGLEDEEEMPDWATEEVAPAAAPQPAAKRSLLLETLNVKPAVAAPAPAAVVQQTSVSYDSIGSLNHSHASLLAPVPALLRVEPTEWQYMDPQGNVQGPFEQDNMRAWHEAGYFNADLPIKLRHWTGFHIFQTVFPDNKNAFLSVPSEPGSSLLLSLQQQQQQQLLRQQQEQQRQAEEHARQQHLLQQQKLEQERAHVLRQQQLQQQQQEEEARRQQQMLLQQQREQAVLEQQRFLLEQERLQAAAAAAAQQAAAAQPAPKPATVAPWANKQPGPNRTREESLLAIQSEEKARSEEEKKRQAAEQAKITKGWAGASGAANGPSLAEIQQQEEAVRQRQAQAEASRAQQAAPATTNMSFQLKNLLGVKAAPAPAAASSGPVWGSSAATPAAATGSKGSLRDIMQQEEVSEGVSPVKGAAASASAPRKPLSWAAKAGSSGPAIFTAPVPAPAPRAAPKPFVAAPVAPVAAPAAAKPVAKSNTKEKSDFGGKEMSKDMADWCAAQLKRLKGSDDLTLVQFCMSLDSAVEVREYLSEYLGSSPEVTNFATDFIKYKEGGRRAVGNDSASAPSASAISAGSNNNNPSAFVSANKKKKGANK